MKFGTMSNAIRLLTISSVVLLLPLLSLGDLCLKDGNSSQQIPSVNILGADLIPVHKVAKYCGIEYRWDPAHEIVRLSKGGIEALMCLGNRYLFVGNKRLISLSSGPIISDGHILLPVKDVVSILKEMMPNKKVNYDETKSMITFESVANQQMLLGSDFDVAELSGNFELKNVVIDPGHGGHDPGATRSGVREKDVVLDVALRLEKALKQRTGLNVHLTRNTDEFIPLPTRTDIANRFPPNNTLFISIHCNAVRARSGGQGTEVYIFDLEATDSEARALAARENMGEPMDLTIILSRCYHIGTEPYTLEFARLLRESLSRSLGLGDRGTRRAAFYVLAGTKMPAVLLELAYISNPEERGLLQDSSFRQKAADAICDAIIEFSKLAERSLVKERNNQSISN